MWFFEFGTQTRSPEEAPPLAEAKPIILSLILAIAIWCVIAAVIVHCSSEV